MADVKPATKSKTVWAGAGVITLSVIAIAVDAWLTLDPVQRELIDDAFGPKTTAVVGLVMVVLRAVTKNAVSLR